MLYDDAIAYVDSFNEKIRTPTFEGTIHAIAVWWMFQYTYVMTGCQSIFFLTALDPKK